VTVGRRVGNGGGRNVAAGTDAVLDDDRLAEPLLKFGSHCAHHDVDAAAGRERDDEGDRSGRELLSEATATERKEACQRGRNQNGTTCDHWSFPSMPFGSRPARANSIPVPRVHGFSHGSGP
jgi:hypothetical protein